MKGYNTDYSGCEFTLNRIYKKKKILIIGCGGAGKSCIISAKNKYPKANIYLFNRDLNKLKNLIRELKLIKISKF